ncbi:hypothetical protein [Prosthecobacter sp.]|uniref:hypothetical protein n=1 Tax=Prosthecobacter sp. TaxID=1965333 RepID=UPI0037840058
MNFRLTKYDPRFRHENGCYMSDEWTSVSDIGRAFNGVILTAAEYMRIESAYVAAMMSFCAACNLDGMVIDSLEMNEPDWRKMDAAQIPGMVSIDREHDISDGLFVSTASLGSVIRSVMREEIWCRLSGAFESYIHFGYDYYSYLGSAVLTDGSFMQDPLLFLESFESPYEKEPHSLS